MSTKYVGYPPDTSDYGADGGVFVHSGTERGTRLPHHVKHSPTGFAWGYGGSGPADLARCLLIHALGDDAVCKTCGGSGWVKEGPDGNDVPAVRGEDSWNCFDCEEGLAVVPALYQDFKWDIIAKLPQGQAWSLTRDEILAWVAAHAQRGGEIDEHGRVVEPDNWFS